MSTEQTESTTQQPAGPAEAQAQPTAEWGAPPPPAASRSKWTVKRTVIAAVVAVGITAAGGAAIYAASGSVTNDQGGPAGMGGGARMVMGGPFGGENGTQHGEFQTGEVTEVSDTSITVKSEDDYTQTYAIDDESQVSDGIEKGDEVSVIATTEGDTTTAETVIDMDAMQQGGGRGGNGGPPNGGNNGTPPTTK